MNTHVSGSVYAIQGQDNTCHDIGTSTFQDACNRYKNGGSLGPSVELYHSDSCSSDLQAFIDESTNCADLGTRVTSSVWGVKIGSRCYDISDTNSKRACTLYQNAASQYAVGAFHSDSCASDLLAYLGPRADCTQIQPYVSSSVWGITQNGQCNDISDESFSTACPKYKSGIGNGNGVQFYHSDSCSDSLLGAVNSTTDCAAFGPTVNSSVWGVKVGSKCFDINDTDATRACTRYKAGFDNGAVAFHHSDSCNGSLIAFVSGSTACSSMTPTVTEYVWGIGQGGTCEDITDSAFASACERYKGGIGNNGGVGLYYSDSCSSSYIAGVTEYSDCSALQQTVSTSVWGVKIDNQCYDISDTNVLKSCSLYKAATNPSAGFFYHSDNCSSSELQCIVSQSTDCTQLSSYVSGSVWGIKRNNSCYDINDKSFTQACTNYKVGVIQ